MVIGSDPGGQVVLTGVKVAPRHALIRASPDGQVSIHRADEGVEVLVNGVRLGAQPTPLLHGDKVVIGGHELRYGDERRSGSTQFMHVDQSAFGPPDAPGPGAGPAAGGRMISLTDGREYGVAGGSVVIGRSTECDVVLTSRNVSRRHAEIIESARGYVIVDNSTNGTFVNGDRVSGQRVLERGDVIRIGEDEFRFYAEQAEKEEDEAPTRLSSKQEERDPFLPDPSKARGEGSADAAGPPGPPPGAEHQLRDTLFGVPGVKIPGITRGAPPEVDAEPAAKRPPPPSPAVPEAPRAPKAPVLANLVVRSGELKGKRFAVRVPIANIGRAEYNDVVIPDDSVSTSHAKLQRREGIWVLVDLDSTNGTRVDGDRVRGEAPLAPGARVQFGNVETFFEPTDDAAGVKQMGGTKVIDKLDVGARFPSDAPPPPQAAEPPTPRSFERGPSARPNVPPTPSEPEPEQAQPDSSQTFTRVIWGLLVLVVLAVLIIVFAG